VVSKSEEGIIGIFHHLKK